jgi:sec-independent protein translocase protein TatB
MFDVGWTELLVIAVVAIIVVGPKDLPRMLRAFGQTVGKMRRMANEFQSTFNDALKEAEREADILDMKKSAEEAARGVQNFDPLGDLKKSITQPLTAATTAVAGEAAASAASPAPAQTTAAPQTPASGPSAPEAVTPEAVTSAPLQPAEASSAASGPHPDALQGNETRP